MSMMSQTHISADYEKSFNVLSLSILSSSQISNRASLVVDHLARNHGSDDTPPLCKLHAKAKVANKLISVVEIAKRDLKTKGQKVYQYSSLASETITLEQNDSNSISKTSSTVSQDPGADDDSFQTMEPRAKIRNVPVMTVVLAARAIPGLKSAIGYDWISEDLLRFG